MLSLRRSLDVILTISVFVATSVASICPLQGANELYAGGLFDISIPNVNCSNAELQFDDGTFQSFPVGPPLCTNTSGTSLFSLALASNIPLGSLNLTVFCNRVAPVCLSFIVQGPTNQSQTRSQYTMQGVCPSVPQPIASQPLSSSLSNLTNTVPGVVQTGPTSSGLLGSVSPTNLDIQSPEPVVPVTPVGNQPSATQTTTDSPAASMLPSSQSSQALVPQPQIASSNSAPAGNQPSATQTTTTDSPATSMLPPSQSSQILVAQPLMASSNFAPVAMTCSCPS